MRNKWVTGCFVLAILLLFIFPGSAKAVSPLSVSVRDTVSVNMGLRQMLTLTASPASAALGVDCGLAEMCGIDPCTCGSADDWGHCSCNGTKQMPVSYKVTVSNPAVAKATVSGDKLVVKGIAAGSTKVTVTAHLEHYADAVRTVAVTVQPPWYLLWILPAAAVAAAVIFFLRRRNRKKYAGQAGFRNE
ncbi:MAG: Ig-like domain-containing protein [Ethanoligenens sp.]